MITDEDKLKVTNATVMELLIGLQILERSSRAGVILPSEFAVIGEWRNQLIKLITEATGKNIDEIGKEQS